MVLQSIRDRLTGIVLVFIVGILIVPFAFVGVSSYFQSDSQNSVAVVNDQQITLNQYNQGFQNYRRRMQAQMGAAFDPEEFDQPIIRRQYLDQLIDQQLLMQASNQAGLTVSNERLAEAIRNLSAFEVDGEFNADAYQSSLAAQGLSPQQFEADMRSNMVLSQFPTSIAASAIATDWEVKDYVRLQDQKRAFGAAVVHAAADDAASPDATANGEDEQAAADTEAAADDAIPEEDLVAWYDAHQADYMSEEQVVISYVELDASKMGGAVEPSEETLKARFEDQKARFVTPEARLASHILIEVAQDAPEVDIESAKDKAEDLARRAREGEDFAELAKKYSEDLGSASKGGDLGWVEPGFMVKAFEDALYSLTMEHPISDPVQTAFGWHVIELRDIRPAEGMTFAEARPLLLDEYKSEEDERRFLEQADRLVDIIYEDPTTLDTAAQELGLEIKEAGPFGREGGEEGIAANMDVVKAAFSDLVLAQGAVSDPIDLGTNHIVLIKVKDHMPEALRPLAEVRDQVVAAVKHQRAMDAAKARAEEILAQVNSGKSMEEVTTPDDVEFVSAEAATRNQADLDPRLLEQLFEMPRPADGSPVNQVIELDDGYAVVQLTSVTDGELSDDDQLREQAYTRRITNASASEETFGFLRMLRAQSTVEVHEDRL